MPTLAESLKAIAYSVRAIPGQLGLRPYTVTVALGEWSGDVLGEGSESVTSLTLTEAGGQPPKVRWLDGEELALSGLPKGTIEVGPITPDHPGGGTSYANLVQSAATRGETVTYTVTGPEFPTGARFQLVDTTSDRALHYKIRLKPLSES